MPCLSLRWFNCLGRQSTSCVLHFHAKRIPPRKGITDYRARDVAVGDGRRARSRTFVRSDHKKKGVSQCTSHLLSMIPYREVLREEVKSPARNVRNCNGDETPM